MFSLCRRTFALDGFRDGIMVLEVELSDSSWSKQQMDAEPLSAQERSQPVSWKRFLLETLETLLLAMVIFTTINLISVRVRVDGFSMQPTLENGNYVLVNRLAYLWGKPRRGDIIVFRPPMYPEEGMWERIIGLPNLEERYQDYIKRVIGLPGERVKIEKGTVYINDVPLNEPYLKFQPSYTGEWEVPSDMLFVLGDNRNNSSDSHAWGFVPLKNIIGRAELVYWPIPQLSLLSRDRPVLAAP